MYIRASELHIAAIIGNKKNNSTVTNVYSSVWTAYHSENWERKEKLVTCTINDLGNVLLLDLYLNLNIWLPSYMPIRPRDKGTGLDSPSHHKL
jgi:hypothetical protein